MDLTTDESGTLFWSPPKRAPTPLRFDVADAAHREFVEALSLLWAEVWDVAPVPVTRADAERAVAEALPSAALPAFVPKKKKIVTDENAKAEEVQEEEEAAAQGDASNFDAEVLEWTDAILDTLDAHGGAPPPPLQVLQFEKDDDANHHIDFMAATANLRARMYAIEEGDRLKVKSIAGRIMPGKI